MTRHHCNTSLGLAVTCAFVLLAGCASRAEESFIFTNDGSSKNTVSDCLVKILSPPGQVLGAYNRKDIILYFRDTQHQPLIERNVSLQAAMLKPTIDWSRYPRVRVSFADAERDSVFDLYVDLSYSNTEGKGPTR